MQIYFGQVPETACSPDDTVFVIKDDNYLDPQAFYYALEYGSGPGGTDDIMIYDTVGRRVPIDVNSIPELMLALEEVLKISETIANGEKLSKQVADESFSITV